jgi:hypothetical protein
VIFVCRHPIAAAACIIRAKKQDWQHAYAITFSAAMNELEYILVAITKMTRTDTFPYTGILFMRLHVS